MAISTATTFTCRSGWNTFNSGLPAVRWLVLILFAFLLPCLSAAAATGVNAPAADPSWIPLNKPTTVTFTVVITDTENRIQRTAGAVILLRVDRNNQNLGAMHDDGLNGDAVANDKIYSVRVDLNESVSSPQNTPTFRASAAFQGSLTRVLSSVISLDVVGDDFVTVTQPFVGTNINVATGADNPITGDPYFQKDTESCVMVSPRDPQTRAVAYIEFAPITTTGAESDPDEEPDGIYFEAWPSLAVTHDGLHYYKISFPGRPSAYSPADMAFRQQFGITADLDTFGSDPMCTTTPGGKMHVVWLGGIRTRPTSGKDAEVVQSQIFVSTFEHLNNQQGVVNVQQTSTVSLATAAEPGLVDKPDILGDTSGNLLACWTKFLDSESLKDFETEVYCSIYKDKDKKWLDAKKVSDLYMRNQGVLILLNPSDNSWHVIWRLIAAPGTDGDRMLMVSSKDGVNWTSPVSLPSPIPAYDLTEHQASQTDTIKQVAFRATAYPAGAFDLDGRLYIAWTQKVRGSDGVDRPKVALTMGIPSSSTALTPPSYSWSAPVLVADGNDAQVLPAVVTGGGQISVAYISFPANFPDLPGGVHNNDPCVDPGPDQLKSICGLGRRMEARLVQAAIPPSVQPPPLPSFSTPSVALTKLLTNTAGQEINKWGDPKPGDDPNKPIWRGGLSSFIGDYFGLSAGQDFVRTDAGNDWRWAMRPTDYAARNVIASIPSNRDVHDAVPRAVPWKYKAATDPTQCDLNPLSRDSNIYVVDVFNELRAYAYVTAQKLDMQREQVFPFTVEYRTQNPNSPSHRSFRLTVIPDPAVSASFVEPPQPVLREIPIQLEKNTSFTWSVHALSTNPTNLNGRFRIEVVETDDLNGPVTQMGKKNTILFNQDSPANTTVPTSQTHDPEFVFSDPIQVSSPFKLDSPANPLVSSPLVSSPLVSSPLVSSQVNTDSYIIASNALLDPQLASLAKLDSSAQNTRDIVLTVQNAGTVTSSFNGFIHIPGIQDLINLGYQFQLIVERVYSTPFLDKSCKFTTLQFDEVISSITSDQSRVSTPLVSSPLVSSPLVSSPGIASPLVSSPLVSSPLVSSTNFALAPSSVPGSSQAIGRARLAATVPPDSSIPALGAEANQVKLIVRVFAPNNLPAFVVDTECGGNTGTVCHYPPAVEKTRGNDNPVDFTIEAHRPDTVAPTQQTVPPPSISTLTLKIETTSLPDGVRGVPYETQTVLVSGGASPFRFSGNLPQGLSLDQATGQISGTPTATNTTGTPFTVQVTDSSIPPKSASQTLGIRVSEPLGIVTATLPSGAVGQLYNQVLNSTGGIGTPTWSLFSGSLGALGLDLSAAGVISGTPKTPGTFNFVAKVVDSGDVSSTSGSQPQQTTKALTITVNVNVTAPIDITCAQIAQGNFQITSPNTKYRLASDCVLPSTFLGPAIAITADNVDLDLNNKTISRSSNCGGPPPSGPSNYGVAVGSNGAHVAGGSVTGFVYGVFLQHGSGNHLNGLKLTNNNFGVYLSGSSNNHIDSANPTTDLTQITGSCDTGVTLAGNLEGTQIVASNGNQIIGNHINGNLTGVFLSNANFNVIDSNDISSNKSGVQLNSGFPAHDNTIQNNVINDTHAAPGGSGIAIETRFVGSGNNSIIHNTANGNDVGIRVATAGNLIQGNTTNNNLQGGISVAKFANDGINVSGNIVQNNTAQGNGNVAQGTFDVLDFNFDPMTGDPPCRATWTNNNYKTSRDPNGCIQASTFKPLSVVTTALPDGVQGIAYDTSLAIFGGTSPFTFSVVGNLPPGLNLIPNTPTANPAHISGTPTTVNTTGTTFKISVTDSSAPPTTATSQNLTIRIGAPLKISTISLPGGALLQAYNQTLTTTGGIGTKTFSLFSGSLPGGLTLSAAGVITGTPTAVGTSNFTVKVIDSSDLSSAPDLQTQQATQALAITVNSIVNAITSCATIISAPGFYRLDVDCALQSSATANAITIRANDVDLDLNGHTISGPYSFATNCSGNSVQGIYVVGAPEGILSRVHVSGGTVKGFNHGIHFQFADGHMNGLTLTDNFLGVFLLQANNILIEGNTVKGNCTAGIELQQSNYNRITGNTITDNGTPGFGGVAGVYLSDSDANIIGAAGTAGRNEISRNKDIGVSLDGGDNNNTIQNNMLIDNGPNSGRGIFLYTGDPTRQTTNNNYIIDNVISGSETGIEVASAGNVIQGNTTNSNLSQGIFVGSGSSGVATIDNLIQGNTARDNPVDLRDSSPKDTTTMNCVNTWRNNTYGTKNDPNTCIPSSISLPLQIKSTSLADGVQGTAYDKPLLIFGGATPLTFSVVAGTNLPPGLNLNPNTGHITGTPTTVNLSGTTFRFTVTDSSVPPVSVTSPNLTIRVGVSPVTSISSCPFTISSPGEYRLDVDCTGLAGGEPVIKIQEVPDGRLVHLNMNGHTISGPITTAPDCNLPNSYGIAAIVPNVHIDGNGTVKGFTNGIVFFGFAPTRSHANHVNNVTVTGNCFGIVLFHSDRNQIDHTIVSRNFTRGAEFGSANDNTFDSNTVTDTDGTSGAAQGVLLTDSNRNFITSNEISGNKRNGLQLVESSNNNTILGNTKINGNLGDGIQLGAQSTGNVVQGNTTLGNGGFDLADLNLPANCINTWSGNTFVTDNEVGANAGPNAGCIQGSLPPVTLIACAVSGNPGVTINAPGFYRLAEDCVVPSGNGNIGIAINSVVTGVDLDLNGHTISGPQASCSINSTIGIIAASANANIHNGTLTGHQVGLEFYGDRSSINNRDNNAYNLIATNNCEGIRLFDADHNNVHDNTLPGNINAITFQRSNDNTIASNTISNTGPSPGEGILMEGSNRNVFTSNVISNNHVGGMRLLTSNNNVINGNMINNNAGEGLRIDAGSTGNVIQNNIALTNGVDLLDSNTACVNTWTNNTFVIDSEGDGPGAGCIR